MSNNSGKPKYYLCCPEGACLCSLMSCVRFYFLRKAKQVCQVLSRICQSLRFFFGALVAFMNLLIGAFDYTS